MMIQISRYGGPLGSFTEDEIREGLRTGRFLVTDTGWMEGMAVPLPLSEFTQFAGASIPNVVPPATPVSEVLPPPMQALPTAHPHSAGTAAATVASGLPWENRAGRGVFEALFQTVILVLTKPSEAFDIMRKEGGMWDPLVYAFIGGTAGALINFLFSFMLNSLGVMADRHSAFGALLGMGVGAVVGLILIPLFVILGTFVSSAIVHVCLLIVGGANRPFETTYRVLCFSSGSTNLLLVVPFCGGVVAGVWHLVVNCIGLARAHQTDTWRAVLAVLLPVIICCGGVLFFAIFFGTLGAMGVLGGHH